MRLFARAQRRNLLLRRSEAKSIAQRATALRALCIPAFFAATIHAQQTIGTISTTDADVTGIIAVHGTTADIQTSGTIRAHNAASQVKLTRGGAATVCANSILALSQANTAKAPLLIALQRGAAELKLQASASDVIMTTDLRFDLSNPAPLDLQIRTTPTGDTCVDNRGKDAPILHVTEQFGASGGYFIKPNQRVLFEHGSIREVVDRETSNCGCPAPPVLAGNSRDPHPFPEAVSQGLEDPKIPQAAPGVEHTTVSATVSYNSSEQEKRPVATTTSQATTTPPQVTTKAPQAATNPSTISRPFRAIGRFFKRIFTSD